MPKTSYISTHGMIWGEISDAGVTRSYGHDALGSVTETFVSGAIGNLYRYKPYGGLVAKTGSATDPMYLWNGGRGYRSTDQQWCNYYVRRRHYSVGSAHWTTTDPIWPDEPSYQYVSNNPTLASDPSGLLAWPTGCCGKPLGFTLVNVETISRINLGGNNFSARLTFQVGKAFIGTIPLDGTPCSAEWWEKTNIPTPELAFAGMTRDTWFPVSDHCSESKPGWCTWKDLPTKQQALSRPCKSPAQVDFSDEDDQPAHSDEIEQRFRAKANALSERIRTAIPIEIEL